MRRPQVLQGVEGSSLPGLPIYGSVHACRLQTSSLELALSPMMPCMSPCSGWWPQDLWLVLLHPLAST